MKVFEKQGWHWVGLAGLLWGTCCLWGIPSTQLGSVLGISTKVWMALAVTIPIVHQIYVWLTWRLELHYQTLSRLFGSHAFSAYGSIFMFLLVARLIVLFPLAIANQGTISIDRRLLFILAVLSLTLAGWVLVSILKHFSIKRAMGIDHFDPRYRNGELVKEGAFKYFPNAMYSLGLLILWVPGWVFASKAAILAAGFAHAYVWLHYFTTERPDMKMIYGLQR
jgi:hypothetical protein